MTVPKRPKAPGNATQYAAKLDRERSWYTAPAFNASSILNCRLLYSPERHHFNYTLAKMRLAALLSRISSMELDGAPRVLIAPVGDGGDLQLVKRISSDVTGVDISDEALKRIVDPTVKLHLCDMRDMKMLDDDTFDVVIVSLFFHHYVKFGFRAFLSEVRRVLRPGGHLVSLEPSALHPVWWLTWLARHAGLNPSGVVADEAAFFPGRLVQEMKRCGFEHVRVQAASFSHNRIPIWLTRGIDATTRHLRKMPPFNYFGWLCVFDACKPRLAGR